MVTSSSKLRKVLCMFWEGPLVYNWGVRPPGAKEVGVPTYDGEVAKALASRIAAPDASL